MSMFALVARNFRYASLRLLLNTRATITTSKQLADKKKALYKQTQAAQSRSPGLEVLQEQLSKRQERIQEMLFELGKEISSYFSQMVGFSKTSET